VHIEFGYKSRKIFGVLGRKTKKDASKFRLYI